MAPQKKPINWKEVETAMMAGSTQIRIAGHQGVEADTLRRRFEEEYGETYTVYEARLHRKGEALLEVAQIQKALNNESPGSTQMLIWLGKQKLGQRDHFPEQSNLPPKDKDIEEKNAFVQQLYAQNKEIEELKKMVEELKANVVKQ